MGPYDFSPGILLKAFGSVIVGGGFASWTDLSETATMGGSHETGGKLCLKPQGETIEPTAATQRCGSRPAMTGIHIYMDSWRRIQAFRGMAVSFVCALRCDTREGGQERKPEAGRGRAGGSAPNAPCTLTALSRPMRRRHSVCVPSVFPQLPTPFWSRPGSLACAQSQSLARPKASESFRVGKPASHNPTSLGRLKLLL